MGCDPCNTCKDKSNGLCQFKAGVLFGIVLSIVVHFIGNMIMGMFS